MNKEKDFNFNIWDIDKHIFEMGKISKKLEEEYCQMVVGGKISNKFIASLASLSILTSTGAGIPSKLNTANASVIPVSDTQNQNKVEQQTVDFLTKQQVIEDIEYVMDTIKKYHLGCITGIPEEVLEQKELEIKNLCESTNSVEEWRIISRILARLHDAHSSALAPEILYGNRLPFNIEFNNNKFFCTSGEFKGAEITEINGTKISDIYENFKINFSYEIEEWAHVHFFRGATFFTQLSLARAGIDTFKPVEVTFRTDSGVKTQKFEFVPIEYKLNQKVPFVSYKIDKESSMGIFTLNKCDFNEEYCETVDKFFSDVASNNVRNVVVDLRRNTGGNSEVGDYFARYLKNLENIVTGKCEIRNGNEIQTINPQYYTSEDLKSFKADRNLFDGKVFILTSNVTFSSAMLFACDFSDNNLATIVGEVPGNSPSCFGDISNHDHETPNSRLKFYTTYKRFYRPDTTKDQDRLIPDIQVLANDALNKIYEIIETDDIKP